MNLRMFGGVFTPHSQVLPLSHVDVHHPTPAAPAVVRPVLYDRAAEDDTVADGAGVQGCAS